MQPTTTCPRSNRVGRYPFITPRPSSRVSPNSSLSSKEQHLQQNQHQESGHKISETLSWHLLDDALLRPRCKAFIDSAPADKTPAMSCRANYAARRRFSISHWAWRGETPNEPQANMAQLKSEDRHRGCHALEKRNKRRHRARQRSCVRHEESAPGVRRI